MKKNVTWFRSCALLGILLSVTLARAQDDAGVFKVNVRLVEVYATVLDHKGHYVDGLGRDSFEVLEDGRPQSIHTFETNSDGISCAILLDTTASMTAALPRVKNSVVKLIDELADQDSVAIFTFDRRLVVRQDFTTDKDAAKRAVLRTRAEGETALFDALSESAEEVSKRSGKKALIVFTDGDDNSSVLNANSAVTRAKKLGIPLYSVAEGEAMRSPKLKKLLEDLSENTGGISYHINKLDDIGNAFREIADVLQHLYMISYKPTTNPADAKWRKISLEVKGSQDYKIRAKEGYFPN
ncbi:MAG: VWA domain-containing protein [Candidatus Sulfotelmatobacter sp.]